MKIPSRLIDFRINYRKRSPATAEVALFRQLLPDDRCSRLARISYSSCIRRSDLLLLDPLRRCYSMLTMARAVDCESTLTSFDAAFQRLQSSISKEDHRSFQSTTVKDVWEAAKSIENYLASIGKLRRFRRIESFLSGLEQYSKVIEVLCNGTPYLPYIWVCQFCFCGVSTLIILGACKASPTGRPQ